MAIFAKKNSEKRQIQIIKHELYSVLFFFFEMWLSCSSASGYRWSAERTHLQWALAKLPRRA